MQSYDNGTTSRTLSISGESFVSLTRTVRFCSYESLVGPHRGSALFNEARTHIISAIQTKCDKVSLVNSEKIIKLLSSAKQAYQEAYGIAIQTGVLGGDGAQDDSQQNDGKKQEDPPISPKRLLDIHKAGIKAGQEAFEKYVKAAGLPWVGPGDDHYDFHLYTSLQYSKKQFDKLRVWCYPSD
jgi:hypothetical protein